MSLPTRRQYLVALGLAKEGRGRFSAAATAALAEAEANGQKFAEPEVKAPAPKAAAAPKPAPQRVASVESKVDATAKAPAVKVEAKAVRAWAATQGIVVGARGRIHADVIAQYVAQGGRAVSDRAPRAARVTPKATPQRRSSSLGWAVTTHRLDKPGAKPFVLGLDECSKGHRLNVCDCSQPVTSAQWGSAPIVFDKPVA